MDSSVLVSSDGLTTTLLGDVHKIFVVFEQRKGEKAEQRVVHCFLYQLTKEVFIRMPLRPAQTIHNIKPSLIAKNKRTRLPWTDVELPPNAHCIGSHLDGWKMAAARAEVSGLARVRMLSEKSCRYTPAEAGEDYKT